MTRRLDARKKAGKVFGLGVLIIYVLAATAGLIYVLTEFNGQAANDRFGKGVGELQGSLLAASERVSTKEYYLSSAATTAVNEAVSELYADQATFFLTTDGDGDDGLPCGEYTYALWNTNEEECLLGNQMKERVLTQLPLTAQATLARLTRAHPGGAFNPSYDARAVIEANGIVETTFTATMLEREPVLYGTSNPGDAAILEGAGVHGWLSWPAPGAYDVSSCFGPRDQSSVAGAASNVHHGLDIATSDVVVAAADGTVLNDPSTSSYGAVWIDHGNGLSTRYMHLRPESITVKKGDVVRRGQQLGVAGNTGCAASGCGVHLHFEVLVQNVPKGETAHAYEQSVTPGWYAVNPVCMLNKESVGKASTAEHDTRQTCDHQADWRQEWCAEYGFSVEEAEAFLPGTRTGVDKEGTVETTVAYEEGEDASRPSNLALSPGEQDVFKEVQVNMVAYGWESYVVKASAEYDASQALLLGVITQESKGVPDAVSPTGAAGIMQFTTATAREYDLTVADGIDERLDPAKAIPAGARYLAWLLDHYTSYTSQNAFAIASYNVGLGVVDKAIQGVGDSDPSWEDVAAYLEKHPELISYFNDRKAREQKVKEVTGYVSYVSAYARAWNGGAPLDDTTRVTRAGEAVKLGELTWNPSVRAGDGGALKPLFTLASWVEDSLDACAHEGVPSKCFLERARAKEPVLSQECEVPGVQYLVALSQAMRDCRENGQRGCQCPLPAPEQLSEGESYTLLVDAVAGEARITAGEAGDRLPGLYATSLSEQTVRVAEGSVEDGIVPALLAITIDEHGSTLTYQERLAGEELGEPVSWTPGWTLSKSKSEEGRLVFNEEAGEEPLCAPVKRHYTFCTKVAEGWPTLRFALTIKDEERPEAPTALFYNSASNTATFASSTSPDVAFYNVYAEQPVGDTVKPLFQLFDAAATSIDTTALAPGTYYVTTVDQAGQESEAVTFTKES